MAIVCDFANEDHRKEGEDLIVQYGFKRIMDNLFESTTIGEKHLVRLKKELDTITDSYDSLRFYQFPMDETFVISYLREKKWRKLVVRV